MKLTSRRRQNTKVMGRHSYCIVTLVLFPIALLVNLDTVHAGRWIGSCSMSNSPILELAVDPAGIDGDHVVLGPAATTTAPATDGTRRRRLDQQHQMRKGYSLLRHGQERGVGWSLTSQEEEEHKEENDYEGDGIAAFRVLQQEDHPSNTNAISDDKGIDQWQREQVRYCFCELYSNQNLTWSIIETSWYCPAQFHQCIIPDPEKWLIPRCVNEPPMLMRVRQVWPAVLGTWMILLSCLLFTTSGHAAMDFCIVQCCRRPQHNEWVVDRMLRKDPERAKRLLGNYRARRRRQVLQTWTPAQRRAYIAFETQRRQEEQERRRRIRRRQRRVAQDGITLQDDDLMDDDADDDYEPDRPRRPTKLRLRTRIHLANKNAPGGTGLDITGDPLSTAPTINDADNTGTRGPNSNNSDEELVCCICFAPIVDGERVGNLNGGCSHLFHADCLKEWLLHRNTCPLCQTDHVAEEVYDNKEEEDGGGGAGAGAGEEEDRTSSISEASTAGISSSTTMEDHSEEGASENLPAIV